MSLLALLPAAIQIGSSLLGSKSANKQANNQIQDFSGYEQAATGRFDNLMSQTRQDFQPYYQTGADALGRLNALMANPGMALANDPGYQFRLGQGVEAIDRSAASQGMLNSGGTLKAQARYGQGLASEELNNIFNRNNVLAGYGLNAAQGNATVGTAGTEGINNALLRATLGRSSAYADKANTNQGLWGGIAGAAQSAVGNILGGGNSFGGYGNASAFTDPNQLQGLWG